MFLKKDKTIYITVIILSLLYFLSFSKSCTNTDKREILKTALVNQKYANQINQFILSKGESKITLTKKNNYWLLSENDSELTIPVSHQKIENFINDLISVRNMYKLSDKIDKNSSYGLSNSETFTITYVYPEGIHTVYFGNQDFAQTSRYLMTDKNTQIYEIDSSLDKYLTTNTLNWSNSFIVSQEILGTIKKDDVQSIKVYSNNGKSEITDVEKFLDLRHGGFPDFLLTLPQNTELSIVIELGNKCAINIEIYSTNLDSQYIAKTEYINSKNEKYYSCCKISSWTYNKIKDITL